jgi:hypothetical protein
LTLAILGLGPPAALRFRAELFGFEFLLMKRLHLAQ